MSTPDSQGSEPGEPAGAARPAEVAGSAEPAGRRAELAPAEVRPGGPAADPINAGMPASMPAGMPRWEPTKTRRSGYADHTRSQTPEWAAPDPAAVAGPPWPELIAASPYRPPRLIRWPVVIGLAALAAWIGVAIAAAAGGGSGSHQAELRWLAAHESTISQLNQDQRVLVTDKPSGGAVTAAWETEWQSFHNDAVSAASLPNPGGAATVPWREMLNDYAAGSATYLQALNSNSQDEIVQAQRELVAGDQAARRFNQTMGLPTG